MKRRLMLSFVASILLAGALLSGCGFKDIDKRYFVVGMGIDKGENEEKPYRITLKLGVPSIQIDAGKSKTQVETIEAVSIAEGVRMLKSRSEEHTSELQSRENLVCRLLLEKKKYNKI